VSQEPEGLSLLEFLLERVNSIDRNSSTNEEIANLIILVEAAEDNDYPENHPGYENLSEEEKELCRTKRVELIQALAESLGFDNFDEVIRAKHEG
jgi:hypothetical protein